MPAKRRTSRQGAKRGSDDRCAAFEKLLRRTNARRNYQLRLYVTGTTPRSREAVANIRALCDEYLSGHYDLEVIDIYQQPNQAAKMQIIAAPTLVKERPVPLKRIIGNLADRDKIVVGLELKVKESPANKSKAKPVG